jgi:hypothetical protein
MYAHVCVSDGERKRDMNSLPPPFNHATHLLIDPFTTFHDLQRVGVSQGAASRSKECVC